MTDCLKVLGEWESCLQDWLPWNSSLKSYLNKFSNKAMWLQINRNFLWDSLNEMFFILIDSTIQRHRYFDFVYINLRQKNKNLLTKTAFHLNFVKNVLKTHSFHCCAFSFASYRSNGFKLVFLTAVWMVWKSIRNEWEFL